MNGKFNNLEYGAAAPGAPAVFLNDSEFGELWRSGNRYYLVATQHGADRIENIVGKENFELIAQAEGILVNQYGGRKPPESSNCPFATGCILRSFPLRTVVMVPIAPSQRVHEDSGGATVRNTAFLTGA